MVPCTEHLEYQWGKILLCTGFILHRTIGLMLFSPAHVFAHWTLMKMLWTTVYDAVKFIFHFYYNPLFFASSKMELRTVQYFPYCIYVLLMNVWMKTWTVSQQPADNHLKHAEVNIRSASSTACTDEDSGPWIWVTSKVYSKFRSWWYKYQLYIYKPFSFFLICVYIF